MKKKIIFLMFSALFLKFAFAEDFSFLSRLQLDSSNKFADSRVRVDFANKWNAASEYNSVFEIKAFASLSPIKYLSISAGNSFFKKYPVKSAWLSASDDYLKTGKLLKSGIGLLGIIPFNENVNLKLSFSGSPEIWNDSDEIEDDVISENENINLGAAFNLDLFNLVSVGACFYKFNTSNFQYGIYAGFQGNETFLNGLIFNGGFVYNLRDSLMNKTRYAFLSSLGYEYDDLGLGFFLDFISGTGSEYLKKSGKIKSYTDGLVPFFSAIRISYEPVNDLVFQIKGKYFGFYGQSVEKENLSFYTGAEYKISKNYGTVELGLDYSSLKWELIASWKMKVLDK